MIKNIIIAILSFILAYMLIDKYSNNVTVIINSEKVALKTSEKFNTIVFSSQLLGKENTRYTSLDCFYTNRLNRKYEIFQDDNNNYLIFHYNRGTKKFSIEYLDKEEIQEILEHL